MHALAWPGAVTVLALLFRERIRDVLDMPLRRIKVGGAEAEFGRAVEEAAAELPKAPPVGEPTDADAGPFPDFPPNLVHAAEKVPAFAIVWAWNLVEDELDSVLSRNGTATPGDALSKAHAATRGGLITIGQVQAVERVERVRLAADSPNVEITPTRAFEFLELVENLLRILRERPASSHAESPTP